jgi:ABC-type phosphate/phosphonate transport system substrate-binding protein
MQKTDLALELLPLPGSLKHMPNASAVAQSVINNSFDAGFIDQRDWEALPAGAADDEPTRDKLRVLARTIRLPDRLVLASPKLAQETVTQVRDFLLKADQEHPQTLHPLQVSAYQVPSVELLNACQRLTKHAETKEATKQ